MQTIKSSTVAISSSPVKRAGSEISSVFLLLDARPKASRTSLLSLCSRIDNRLCLAATVVRFHFISSFYFRLLSSYILLLLLYYYFTLLKLFPARRHSFTPAQSPSPSASASASPWTTIFSFIFCSSRLFLFESSSIIVSSFVSASFFQGQLFYWPVRSLFSLIADTPPVVDLSFAVARAIIPPFVFFFSLSA